MIWYRHWLELRDRLPFLALAAIVLGAWPLTLFDEENAVFTRLVASGALSSEALSLAIARTFLVVWGGAIVFSGNGVRSWYMDRIAPSDVELPFTLSLPISRARLVRTRLLAGWLVAVLVAVLVMGGQSVTLAAQGRSVPAGPIAGVVACLAAGMACWIVVLGAILMTRGLWLLISLPAGILVCFLLTMSVLVGGLHGMGSQLGLSLAALAALAAGAYLFTMHRVRRMEC